MMMVVMAMAFVFSFNVPPRLELSPLVFDASQPHHLHVLYLINQLYTHHHHLLLLLLLRIMIPPPPQQQQQQTGWQSPHCHPMD